MKAHYKLMIAAILCATHLGAGVIFSTFGPDTSYDTVNGYTLGLGNLFGNSGYSDAFEFTPTESGSLEDILMAIQYIYQPGIATGSNQLDVWLMSDSSGSPGSILESFQYNGTSGNTEESIITLQSSSNPFLTAGTEYWLAAGPADLLNSWFSWQDNDEGLMGTYSQRVGSGSWSGGISGADLPAIEVV